MFGYHPFRSMYKAANRHSFMRISDDTRQAECVLCRIFNFLMKPPALICSGFLALASLFAGTEAQAQYETTTIRPDGIGGLRVRTSDSDGGYSTSTVRSDGLGGYRINSSSWW